MIRTTDAFEYNVDPLTYDHMEVNSTVIVKYIGNTDVGITVTLFTEDREVRKNTLIIPRQCVEAVLDCLGSFNEAYLEK